jgi:nucleotide-binding universal stress UspA family protein
MRSILLPIHEDSAFDSRLLAACDLARSSNGNITCLHVRPYMELAPDPLPPMSLPVEYEAERERNRAALRARIEERLRAAGVRWDWREAQGVVTNEIARAAALADVVVLSRAVDAQYRDDPLPYASSIAIRSSAPVLAVPPELQRYDPVAPALIAWNGSQEAAAAVRAALPLLRIASAVQIFAVEESANDLPDDAVLRFLSRHDIRAELVRRPCVRSIDRTILQAAARLRAGTIVMGAYGRSRFVEFFLGGVTRSLLQQSPIPLLLAN